MAMWMAAIVAPIQILAGDAHGLNTLEHQPIKVLAMEGDYEASPDGAPLILFGMPSNEEARVRYEIAVPHAGSLILKHDLHAPLPGLKDFPRDQWPPALVFWSFRIMVGIGLLMLLTAYWGLWLRIRGNLHTSRAYQNLCISMLPAGFVAVLAGWTVTEVGRQPWVVYGLMRTRDAVTPSLTTGDVLTSIALYVIVYLIVFGSGIFYMARLARAGPPEHVETREPTLGERPARPLSGAEAEA